MLVFYVFPVQSKKSDANPWCRLGTVRCARCQRSWHGVECFRCYGRRPSECGLWFFVMSSFSDPISGRLRFSSSYKLISMHSAKWIKVSLLFGFIDPEKMCCFSSSDISFSISFKEFHWIKKQVPKFFPLLQKGKKVFGSIKCKFCRYKDTSCY